MPEFFPLHENYKILDCSSNTNRSYTLMTAISLGASCLVHARHFTLLPQFPHLHLGLNIFYLLHKRLPRLINKYRMVHVHVFRYSVIFI